MTTNPPTTHQPLLDLQGLLAGIRRRRPVWASLATLGLLAGLALVVLLPDPPTAVTRILVVHEETLGNKSPVDTDVAILGTTEIAGRAVERLGADLPPAAFAASVTAEALADDIVEITVAGDTPRDAVARAQALADAFIADHVRRAEELANADAAALEERRAAAEQELAEVEREIAAAGGASSEAAGANRAFLASRISELGEQAAEASVGAPRAAAGTQIVDPPHAVPPGAVPEGVEFALVGLVLGLGGGLALAAVSTVVRDRPVLRRDIAEHLGASVIAQLPVPRRGLARLWRPSRSTEHGRLAATLARLVRESPGAVSLLELGSAAVSAKLALRIAGELSHERPVRVIDDLPGRPVLRAKASPDAAVRSTDANEPDSAPPVDRPSERRIGVGSVRPGTAWTDLGRLGSQTLLVVRAGHSSAEWLHTVARQLADAGIRVLGVVVVRPDPRDRTDGTLWDGLHTALRGDADRQPSPTARRHAAPSTSVSTAPTSRRPSPRPRTDRDEPAPAMESAADMLPTADRMPPTGNLPAAQFTPAVHVDNP